MTFLFPSPIIGPIKTRRLGLSLGINLLPANAKVCNFDCVYCECGYSGHPADVVLPTAQEVLSKLETRLLELTRENRLPDAITFAGNGEPTLHPKFAEIMDGVIALRDRLSPASRICVLTNSTKIFNEKVFNALQKTNYPIFKLDTVDDAYIARVDLPRVKLSAQALIDKLIEFGPKAIIQTMFLKGTVNGHDVSNVSDTYIKPWLEALKRINPQQVMIYTLDRDTPENTLEPLSNEEIDAIAERVRALGFTCSVGYCRKDGNDRARGK